MLTAYQEQIKQQPKRTKNPKVLIVDDNTELLEELQEMLSSSGYDVETLADPQKAFAVAHQIKPELILLDLKMTPKSGFQVADELKHSLQMRDVPIVAMTGFFTEKEHILMMKLCGIKTFILKPFKPSNLIEKFEYALDHKNDTNQAT